MITHKQDISNKFKKSIVKIVLKPNYNNDIFSADTSLIKTQNWAY